MRVKGNQRNHNLSKDHILLCYEKEAMFCYFCGISKKTNPFVSAAGSTNFRNWTKVVHKRSQNMRALRFINNVLVPQFVKLSYFKGRVT